MTNVGGTAAEYFASMIEEYDSLIRRAVPTYEAMLATTLEYLPNDPATGLELGCGTGNFTLALAERFPGCRWTIVDASDEMVALTRARLAAEAPDVEVECVVGRFEDLAIEPASPGPASPGPSFVGPVSVDRASVDRAALAPASLDIVTSCISLHHVPDKAPVFEGLRGLLRSGGSLCIADQLTGGAPRVADRHWQRWLDHCRAPGQCTEEEVEHLVEHSEAHDHYESLSAYGGYLAEAGFIHIDCVWRDGMWTVVTAEAP